MPFNFNVELKAILKTLRIIQIGNRNITYIEINILYQGCRNAAWNDNARTN
jgi:hypothetical protein